MICYLQPKDILRPLKAAVNEEVLTQYGDGKVTKFRAKDSVYEIELRWGATLYARGETFDRDHSESEEEGGFDIHRVFRWFFSSEKETAGGNQRSRSNSLVSVRTQTSRSLL